MAFETKDSGERAAFASGMVRDTQIGKPRYGLIPRGPLKRLAELYARGAEKYDARNWEKADSADELERFGESAFRHLMQLLDGEIDEDHGAAVAFNVFAFMWLREKLDQPMAQGGVISRDQAYYVGERTSRPTDCPSCGVPGEAYHVDGCTFAADRRARAVPDVGGRDLDPATDLGYDS